MPFKRRDVDFAREDSVRVVKNRGYARAWAREDLVRDDETHLVDVTLHMQEGDIYTIGRVDPIGNTVTKDPVIRRDVMLQPGDTYNEDAMDETRIRLLRWCL